MEAKVSCPAKDGFTVLVKVLEESVLPRADKSAWIFKTGDVVHQSLACS